MDSDKSDYFKHSTSSSKSICTRTKIVPLRTIIHRRYIPRNKITRAHIISLLGPDDADNEAKIETTFEFVKQLKNDALDFFREKVRDKMVKRILKSCIYTSAGVRVMNLKDLRLFIIKEKSLTLSFFKKLFDICYGMFDVTVEWAENWRENL